MLSTLDKHESQLLELYSEDTIQERIKELGKEINNTFPKDQELVVIAVLAGSILFASDLIRRFHMPTQFEFVRLSSYGNDQKSSGRVKPLDLTLPGLTGKNVLIVEDIVDTGFTANFMLDYIKLQHKPANIKFATLLDKSCARQKHVDIDFRGFEVDDKFVVGYGLDYLGYFRNLPYIGYFPQ